MPDPYSPDPYLGELDYDIPLPEEVTDAHEVFPVGRQLAGSFPQRG
jgi:hypothetical protein